MGLGREEDYLDQMELGRSNKETWEHKEQNHMVVVDKVVKDEVGGRCCKNDNEDMVQGGGGGGGT